MGWKTGLLSAVGPWLAVLGSAQGAPDVGWISASVPSEAPDARIERLLRQVEQTVQDGKAQAALDAATELVDFVEANRPNDNHALADAYCAKGVALVELDRFQEARIVFERMEQPAGAARSPDTADLLFCLTLQARNESLMGNHSQARAMLRALIDDPYWQANGTPLDLSGAYRSLAVLLSRQGRFGDAEPMARKAYAMISEAFPANHFRVGTVREGLAQILFRSGRPEPAIALLEETIAHRVEQLGPNHPTPLQLRSALAIALLAAGRGEEAVETTRDIYETFNELRGPKNTFTLRAAHAHADALRAVGRLTEAREVFRRVRRGFEEVFDASHPSTLRIVADLASLAMRQNDAEEARSLVSELASQQFAVLAPDDINLSTVWFLLGDLLGSDELSRAQSIFAYKMGVNILQQVRVNMNALPDEAKAAFIAQRLGRYERLQNWLVREGRFAEAEQVGRMIKNTEYVGFLRGGSTGRSDEKLQSTPSEKGWKREFTAWQKRPGLLSKSLREAREAGATPGETAALQQAADEAYADYRKRLNAWLAKVGEIDDRAIQQEAQALNIAQSDRLQDLVAGLGEDVAMVQIVALPDSVSFFVITPDAFIHREAEIGREELLRAVFEVRESILFSEDDEVSNTLQTLHSALFQPIAQDLKDAGIKTLMLNLQGRLRYVPFAALYDGKRYVVEEFELARFTSSASLAIDGSKASTNGAGFGLSAAVSGFTPLPAVERELSAVFSDDKNGGVLNGEVTLNKEFTRNRLEQELRKGVPILHIASHFQMNSGDASQSFLILGDGTRLTLSEISYSGAIRFRGVELVTLSACSTGLAGGGTGLEVEGLGALIQNKGADAVLSTLWNVSDDATADLMIDFYSGFTRDGLSKAAALRRAQMAMINSEKSAPFFWAPFILSGDWK